jgi:hypothetical protein
MKLAAFPFTLLLPVAAALAEWRFTDVASSTGKRGLWDAGRGRRINLDDTAKDVGVESEMR